MTDSTNPNAALDTKVNQAVSLTPKTLDFYFEMGSPYAYVAAEKIDALAALYDFKVSWKPIFLGILFKETGAAALTTAHPWKSSYFMHDFSRNARLNGVPYVQPAKFPVATSAAARCVLALQQKDDAIAREFAKGCSRALFSQDQDISDLAVLAKIAEALGLDGTDLIAQQQSDAIKQAFIAAMKQAAEAQVFGSPLFVFADGEKFWGSDRLGQIELHMRAIAGKKSAMALVNEAIAQVKNLTVDQAKAKLGTNNVVFVDIRDPRELEREGMIPDAIQAPRGMLEFWVDPASPYYKSYFTPEKEYILYCGGGWRSALAAKVLQEMAILPNVAHIEGGFADWKKGGGTIVPKPAK